MGRTKLTALQREATFWSRVDVGPADACWAWRGGRFDNGYGAFRYDGRTLSAHRYVARLAYGAKAVTGAVIMHLCDNPACVNPTHLQIGTYRTNMQDASAKGRMARGERVNGAKLTEEAVRLIRSTKANTATLAKRYGVTDDTVRLVRKRRTWKHVP